jgi:hypothetical protein
VSQVQPGAGRGHWSRTHQSHHRHGRQHDAVLTKSIHYNLLFG